ncbi:MAG: hypothetical protein JST59_01700 [Actinobacteria bacterium]|nr:hypothetical protein [Actinomycetota bacterium]
MKDKSLATVFCGPYQTFVQTSKGEIYGMGLNNRGQLGIGNTTDQKSGPVLLHAFSISKKINR